MSLDEHPSSVPREARQAPVIAIDGPSGVGKGTVGRLLARRLGWAFLDSGALYRLVALAAANHAIALDNEPALARLAAHLDVEFLSDPRTDGSVILLEGEDVSDAIRSEECGNAASRVAVLPSVREALLERQRAFREPPGLVADGRDMGSVVFPDAELKVFLAATAEERARRRYNQLKDKGLNVKLPDLFEEIAARDERDRRRSVAPLVATVDAVVVETTALSIEEVVERVFLLYREQLTSDI